MSVNSNSTGAGTAVPRAPEAPAPGALGSVASSADASARGLTIRGLTLTLPPAEKGGAPRELLHGIDLDVPSGRITGLAGESGSGKTVTGLSVMGLQPGGGRLGGSIRLTTERVPGVELTGLGARALNRLRGRELAMVFQDPTASLHPMLSIGAQLTDHLRHHLGLSKKVALGRGVDLLRRVSVPEPETAIKRYPHQFSGGQLQRVAIAVAIACEPAVLIADEPTTALDVTVQAGILRLLRELCDDLNLAILLVTHDLGVMSAVADEVVVMRSGEVVEAGSRYQVIREPRHEYTRSLIDSLPHTPPPGAIAGGSVIADDAATGAAGATVGDPATVGGEAVVGDAATAGGSVTADAGVPVDDRGGAL